MAKRCDYYTLLISLFCIFFIVDVVIMDSIDGNLKKKLFFYVVA